jgi:hypothetical protein
LQIIYETRNGIRAVIKDIGALILMLPDIITLHKG